MPQLAVGSMPLSHAYDELSDSVAHFHNEMLRQGVKEMTPRQWVDEFRSWIDAYEFERQYAQTLSSLHS